jgi:pimeloyl-ACP methyl ester carboxylesterase
MKKITLFLVFGISLLLGEAQAATPSQVSFIVMGGRTSCGSGDVEPAGLAMYKPFLAMLSDLQASYSTQKFQYLVSCLNTDPPPDGEVLYITSEQPTVTQSGDTDELVKQTLSRFGSDEATFVIGHSYGGWMAMYITQNLKSTQKLAGLYTIDPISPNCGPAEVVFGGDECSQAPTELDNVAILNQTNRWLNFYQDSDDWIHSSSIPQAENTYEDYHGPHTEIDVDTRTWSTISAAVKQALK